MEICSICEEETSNIWLLYEKGNYGDGNNPHAIRSLVCGKCLPKNVKRVSAFSYEKTERDKS